jgi:hypothetical protein
MKHLITRVKKAAEAAWLKVVFACLAGVGYASTAYADPINTTDLTKDTSNGKKFGDVAGNLNQAGQQGASLLLSLAAIGGFVIVAISLYALWKASKDEREKPLSAVVGLFIGGAMAGVSTIMWIMKNTVTG